MLAVRFTASDLISEPDAPMFPVADKFNVLAVSVLAPLLVIAPAADKARVPLAVELPFTTKLPARVAMLKSATFELLKFTELNSETNAAALEFTSKLLALILNGVPADPIAPVSEVKLTVSLVSRNALLLIVPAPAVVSVTVPVAVLLPESVILPPAPVLRVRLPTLEAPRLTESASLTKVDPDELTTIVTAAVTIS